MLKKLFVFSQRALYLVYKRKFGLLFDKIRRHLKGRADFVLSEPTDLSALLSGYKGISLIVDHDQGGGANQYRESLVASIVQKGGGALVLTCTAVTGSHWLIMQKGPKRIRCSISSISIVFDSLKTLSVEDLYFNTGVGFAHPEELTQLMISLKSITSANLLVFVHDYFMVCPSHFLLNEDGDFCHIPDPSICANCLPNNSYGSAPLFHKGNIGDWRASWRGLLLSADGIVTFSKSSVYLLHKAYPEIPMGNFSVVPHEVDAFSEISVAITNSAPLCIGIVGHIGFHKGAMIVQNLSREIKRQKRNVKIVIIGDIEVNCPSAIVQETRAYRHDQLPRLIEESGANVMLFPSICPETFSYVVEELINLQLPVACFDLGAPAERISMYAKGHILTSMDAMIVLNELVKFHSQIYSLS